MKRGSTDSRGAEKRSAVGGVLLFGLFQLACAAGFGALCTIPELPRWLEILFTTLAVGCLGLVLPVLWALNIRIKEIGCAQSDLNQEEFDMLLVNIDYIPGKAGMKTLVGGEITGYTEMLNEARQIAVKRMVDEAESLGADAVINIRYGSSSVMQGAAEVISYGTAVKYR